jgi:hypothetical protein
MEDTRRVSMVFSFLAPSLDVVLMIECVSLRLLLDSDAAVQEQAWAVVRNLTTDEAGMEFTLTNLSVSTLQNSLVVVLSSTRDDVVQQVR